MFSLPFSTEKCKGFCGEGVFFMVVSVHLYLGQLGKCEQHLSLGHNI